MSVMRVRYRERQPLRAADLNDEQAYRIAMRRRHNIGPHGWGIVHGLEVAVEQSALVVQPGMAVDGYGRELLVPEPVSIPDDTFDQLDSESLDVWLLYSRVAETPPQRGRWECGPGQHSRWREEAHLRLTAGTDIDPRLPPAVPQADLDFGPHGTPPDDPGREWPVYLGRIRQGGTDPESTGYEVVPANRPCATLVGETVIAPSGRARMQVGSELAGDRRRFAVSLPDDNGAFADRLTIDRDGDTTLRGNTTLPEGKLIIAEAEARSAPVIASRLARLCGREEEVADEDQVWSIAFGPLDTTPEEAKPWQIYRTVINQDKRPVDQLRLEIGHPGEEGDPAGHRLAIGSWPSDDGAQFQPCLTVDANCTVRMRGDVQVDGSVKEGPITADPADPRFTETVGTRWAQGLLVTGAGTIYGTALEIALDSFTCSDDFRTVTYQITVRNVSGSPISNINVIENLSVDGLPVRRGLILSEFTLLAESSEPIDHIYESRSGTLENREIVLAVTALGVGPAHIPVSASTTEAFKCQSGPF